MQADDACRVKVRGKVNKRRAFRTQAMNCPNQQRPGERAYRRCIRDDTHRPHGERQRKANGRPGNTIANVRANSRETAKTTTRETARAKTRAKTRVKTREYTIANIKASTRTPGRTPEKNTRPNATVRASNRAWRAVIKMNKPTNNVSLTSVTRLSRPLRVSGKDSQARQANKAPVYKENNFFALSLWPSPAKNDALTKDAQFQSWKCSRD